MLSFLVHPYVLNAGINYKTLCEIPVLFDAGKTLKGIKT